MVVLNPKAGGKLNLRAPKINAVVEICKNSCNTDSAYVELPVPGDERNVSNHIVSHDLLNTD